MRISGSTVQPERWPRISLAPVAVWPIVCTRRGLRARASIPWAPGGVVRLPTFRDHRIAMAAGILALRLPGLLIEDPDCVAKSYPRYFRDLEALAVR